MDSGPVIYFRPPKAVSYPGGRAQKRECTLAYLDVHPEFLLVGSRVLIVDEDGDEITVMGNALSHEEIVDAFLANQGQMIYHPAVMFRREAVMVIGGYDIKMIEAEDLDLFLRLAEVGEIVNLPEPLSRIANILRNPASAARNNLASTYGSFFMRRGSGAGCSLPRRM